MDQWMLHASGHSTSCVQDYGKAGLYRARSVLPTLAERNPLSDLQAQRATGWAMDENGR